MPTLNFSGFPPWCNRGVFSRRCLHSGASLFELQPNEAWRSSRQLLRRKKEVTDSVGLFQYRCNQMTPQTHVCKENKRIRTLTTKQREDTEKKGGKNDKVDETPQNQTEIDRQPTNQDKKKRYEHRKKTDTRQTSWKEKGQHMKERSDRGKRGVEKRDRNRGKAEGKPENWKRLRDKTIKKSESSRKPEPTFAQLGTKCHPKSETERTWQTGNQKRRSSSLQSNAEHHS